MCAATCTIPSPLWNKPCIHRRPPAIAGGLLLLLPHSARLITATEAFVAGFAGMAPAHRFDLDTVKIAALPAFIIGATGYAAANRLAANLGLRHTLPPVLGSPSMRLKSMPMRGNGWNPPRPPAPAARPRGLRPPARPKRGWPALDPPAQSARPAAPLGCAG